jgi:hypothetical protein
MLRRDAWRKSAAFAVGLALVAGLLFGVVVESPQAGGVDLLGRVGEGVRQGIRSLAGGRGDSGEDLGAVIHARSAYSAALEADAKARNMDLVRVNDHDFDPRQQSPIPPDTLPELVAPRQPLVPEGAAATDHEYWIVQYTGKPQAMRRALEAAGIESVAFIPASSTLVRVPSTKASLLSSLPAVSWTGEYLPAYKVTPAVRDLLAAGQDTSKLPLDGQGRLRLAVLFHHASPATPYRELLKALPTADVYILEDVPDDRSIAKLTVDPSRLRDVVVDLAFMRDVFAIVSDPIPIPYTDHAVWFLQTGIDTAGATNYDETARLFALGITGQGLLGAVADSGLENDLCQFRYDADVNETCWPIGPDPFGAPPVPLEGGDLPRFGDPTTPPVRTRMRKCVVYYVATGATAYSDEDQHGTTVAGCMLADNSITGAIAARPLVRDVGVDTFTPLWQPGTGTWQVNQELLRPELQGNVDDVTLIEPQFSSTYGDRVQHHDPRDGMAPGAQLVFQDLGNADGTLAGATTAAALLDQAYWTGATVHNVSFGGLAGCDNCYIGSGDQPDGRSWRYRDLNSFAAAGNFGATGARTIPDGFAQAKSTIVVGALERSNTISSPPATRPGENVASFSSKGPSTGGRITPEVMAPGRLIAPTETAVDPEDGNNSGGTSCGAEPRATLDGTSFASPTMAGMGLLVQQYFWDGWYPSGQKSPADAMRPTNALVRAVLVNSARDLQGARTNDTGTVAGGHRPNFGQGWGAPRLDDTLYFAGDPFRNDPRGDTERARFIVLNDVPNGFEPGATAATCAAAVSGSRTEAAPEPGGRLRSDIIAGFRTAITEDLIHTFFLNAITPGAATDPANELRFTLAWSDPQGSSNTQPLVNDLDLEVVSPSGIVYRSSPLAAWQNGYTVPSPVQEEQRLDPITGSFRNFADRDLLNTVENVFIRPEDVEEGPYVIKVIAYRVNTTLGPTGEARPNWVLGDRPCTLDRDDDGTADIDDRDRVDPTKQGYALIASGNFTTTQGLVSLNRSSFDCSGQDVVISLNDQNGDDPARATCDPDGDGTPLGAQLTIEITTSTPSVAFPADREVVTLNGSQPSYETDPLPVVVVNDPTDVIQGNDRIEVASGQSFTATYIDGNPCGGRAFASASVGCNPQVADDGFSIEDGCDTAVPGDPLSTRRPDTFMDRGERNRYTAFFVNQGSTDLHDATVSLVPDTTNPVSAFITVLNNPVHLGLVPPGRRTGAVFEVQVADSPMIPPQSELDFEVCVTSPSDGLFFADCFTQTQVLEADIQTFRYDTRDPAGELFSIDRIKRPIAGADEMSTDPADFIQNTPMWFDPDATCGGMPCSSVCDVPRESWPVVGGQRVPPAACMGALTGNPYNPWDFNDSDEGFATAVYDPDANKPTNIWFWASGPQAGGCGWENELDDQLASLPPGHPDVFANPWGIWHTGEINNLSPGAFPGWQNQGAPFFVDPARGDQNPNHHTIMWDSNDPGPPPTGADNTFGDWCNTYVSDVSTYPNFYRVFLIPPTLYRVHRSRPEYRVEFEELRVYSRDDGHTWDDDNFAVSGWLVHNQPVQPLEVGPPDTYTWGQYQFGILIYTDDTRPDWRDEDSFLSQSLRSTNSDFPDRTYEDIYGPASDSWNFSLTWAHINTRRPQNSTGQYGWGVDDVEFIWSESREVADASDCAVSLQPATVYFGETRYNACEGDLDIVLVDQDPALTLPRVVVCVTSAAEDTEVAILDRVAPGRYEGVMPFSIDPADDVRGTLFVSAGSIDIGQGADTVRVEYDPSEADPDVAANLDPEGVCDWRDVMPQNNINDDLDGDGIADAEDDVARVRERFDTSVINCTSGRIGYIKHRLQQVSGTPGDADRFADHGERVEMAVTLISQLGFDLEDVDITISTADSTVCIIDDTVHLEVMRGSGALTETLLVGGFQFAVPQAVRTTALDAPRTVTFRINVTGRNASDLNQFSTSGEGFNSFLPIEARLLLDVDEVVTLADYSDAPLTGRMPGQFLEGFEGTPGVLGYDHPFVNNIRAGLQPPIQNDATQDTRFGVDLNGGFCPECDFQSDCQVPEDCDYFFKPDTGDPLEPGYPPTRDVEWSLTNGWAKSGGGSYKFGRPGMAGDPTEQGQHYSEGQFTSLELPPMRIASDPATAPELRFWHVVDFWIPFFTSGLITPIGAGVVEISASPIGTGNNNDNVAEIRRVYPLSSFRRLYPYLGSYDFETDALNACGTFFCRYKHPIFGEQGSFIITADPGDVHAGTPGTPGYWEEVAIDLSDFKGMEVVVRFTVAVIADLTIQAGNYGWLVDDVSVTGLQRMATGPAIRLQTGSPSTVDTCALVAAFDTTSADCDGSSIQLFDRHTGLGAFVGTPPEPAPIEYAWDVGGVAIPRGPAGQAIGAAAGPGVDRTSTHDNPRVNLADAGRPPGRYTVTMTLYQNGTTLSAAQEIVYKDSPVPALTRVSPAFATYPTRFGSSVAFDTNIDPDRTHVYEWDFGDGTPISTAGAEVEHAFAATGSYVVTLTVIDEDGCSGSASLVVDVVAGPQFAAPAAAWAADCPPTSPGFGDGDGDLNEYVTLNVDFQNTGATATNVTGYLTSSDDAVEITQGAAFYGTVPMGMRSGLRPFTFIRRPVAGESCVAVPFTLTLVSDAGTVVQSLALSYTMGGPIDVPFIGLGAPDRRSFCAGLELDPVYSFMAPAGCLDGIEINLRVTSTNLATMNRIEVRLQTPDFRVIPLLVEGDGPRSRTVDVHLRFGANDGDAPVPNTNGFVEDVAGTLNDSVEATLVSQLIGASMLGEWQVQVVDVNPGNCDFGVYSPELITFNLEGANSADLDTVTPAPACSACLSRSAPLYTGLRQECDPVVSPSGGWLLWSPVTDTSTCNGLSDVTYQLYASTTPDQLGAPATILGSMQDCTTDCPTGACAYPLDGEANEWGVCDLETHYWTVVAVDGTPGAGTGRTPDVQNPADAVPSGYQTATGIVCLDDPGPPEIVIRKPAAGGMSADVTTPGPYAESYRLFRGTFPTSGTVLRTLGTRGPWNDHVLQQCAFSGPSYDIGADRTTPGSFYYLVASVNRRSCAGLSYERQRQGTRLRDTAPHTSTDACADPFDPAQCLP